MPESNNLVSAQLNEIAGQLNKPPKVSFGTVSKIIGLTIEAKGLMVSLGTICII